MINSLAQILLQIDGVQLYGIDIINVNDFLTLLVRFSINLGVLIVIIRYLYYPNTCRKDYFFTFFLLGTVVFFMCYLLASVKLQLGFALGLFAVFGIIRYRTNPIPIKEMSYLFLVIAISLINAIASKKISYAELVFSNLTLLIVTLILEKGLLMKHLSQQAIIYEKIELIKPNRRGELIDDLKARTGLDIKRVEIGKIDFLKDVAKITIHYTNGINANEFIDSGESLGHLDDE